MTRRHKNLAIFLLLAFLAGVAWWILHVPDPVYQGKPLSYWLDHTITNHDSVASAQAGAAVAGAGKNAIPLLLHLMGQHDSPMMRKLLLLAGIQRFIKSPLPAFYRHGEAYFGFLLLGRQAESAVPELIRIYDANPSSESRMFIISSLESIGPEDKNLVPFMRGAVTNSDPRVSSAAVHALVSWGILSAPRPAPADPPLREIVP